MSMLACSLCDGIVSVVVMEAWLCVIPLFELVMLRIVLCSFDGLVLKSNVSLKVLKFSVCFSMNNVLI